MRLRRASGLPTPCWRPAAGRGKARHHCTSPQSPQQPATEPARCIRCQSAHARNLEGAPSRCGASRADKRHHADHRLLSSRATARSGRSPPARCAPPHRWPSPSCRPGGSRSTPRRWPGSRPPRTPPSARRGRAGADAARRAGRRSSGCGRSDAGSARMPATIIPLEPPVPATRRNRSTGRTSAPPPATPQRVGRAAPRGAPAAPPRRRAPAISASSASYASASPRLGRRPGVEVADRRSTPAWYSSFRQPKQGRSVE